MRNFFKFINSYSVFIFLFLFFILGMGESKALVHVSDALSTSAPGSYADHFIQFQTTKSIPPGGKIVITPQGGFFTVPGGFNYADVDFYTFAGSYIERELGNNPTALVDGVSTVWASTSNANLSITLNSSSGIDANTYAFIELGRNADYGGAGDSQILNPSQVGAYSMSVYTYNASNQYLERSVPKIFISNPVTMSNYIKRVRLNGSPSGWLSFGTTNTIMGLYTNYLATCRYSTASNTPYASMPNEFSYVGINESYFHTVQVNGLTNGATFNYFIRCEDESGGRDQYTGCTYPEASTTPWMTASGTPITELDCLDYWIQFSVSTIAGGTDDGGSGTGEGDDDGEGEGDGDNDGVPDTGGTGTGSGAGGGSSGGGGAGGGAGGGKGAERGKGFGKYLPYPPPPGAPGAVLKGWAYPNVDVIILKDGKEEGRAKADNNAVFGGYLEELVQGVYTFSMWADDSAGRRSKTYSTTFWLDAGTQTTVSDIFLPPTIELAKKSINIGDSLDVYGQTAPGATVEVWLYQRKETVLVDKDVIKTSVKADSLGNWLASVNTASALNGSYYIKAKANLNSGAGAIGGSDFSHILELSIGGKAPEAAICAGADLNHDGKVNITDFSILLYYWGTDNECADQNHNGTVDLIDFSIMMYYWTG